MIDKVSVTQNRIAKLAERLRARQEPITSIHHLVDVEWLREAFDRLPADRAPGIDGVTKDQYGANLGENLDSLLGRVLRSEYWAPAVRRTYIAKDSGEQRPLGISAFEDKVLQKGFVMLIQPVFEGEFHGFSHGFRPNRSAHDAVKQLFGALGWKGMWVIDLDIRKYFDTIPHALLLQMFSKRIKDRVICQLVEAWLKAGAMEGDIWHESEEGTPQGGVISPLLANLYLHEVLDDWFVKEVQPRLKGASGMVRYADDSVLYFENETDARRVLDVLWKRLEKFGLSLHPEKTRLLDFRRPQQGKGESFDFLGFTWYWGKSRRGRMVIKLKTAKKKLGPKLKALYDWIKANRHLPRQTQHQILSAKLRGLYNYYGVSHNHRMLRVFWRFVRRAWFKWLNRTGRKHRMSWNQFDRYLKAFPLPTPTITHALF